MGIEDYINYLHLAKINSLKKSNDSDMDYKNKITILKEKAQELGKELERRESCPQQTKTIQLNDKEEEINIYNCEMVLNNQRIKGNIALLELKLQIHLLYQLIQKRTKNNISKIQKKSILKKPKCLKYIVFPIIFHLLS